MFLFIFIVTFPPFIILIGFLDIFTPSGVIYPIFDRNSILSREIPNSLMI